MFQYSSADLLQEWRWLIGGHPRTIGWSLSGDVFYQDVERRIWRLDTGAAETELVADSRDAFTDLLSIPDTQVELLLRPVVQEFADIHGPLVAGECLGFTRLPVLGGTYSVENRYRLSVEEHAAVTGDMHLQLRDLPDGTAVQVTTTP